MTSAAHCDECRHFDADIVPHEGWPCVEGHKPRFYTPKTVMQAESGDYGWKRRCDDFERREERADQHDLPVQGLAEDGGHMLNREDIIRMAQECRLIGMRPHLDGLYEEALQSFAALVAAAEREACAQLIEDFERFGDTRDCAAAIRARGQA